LQAVLDTYHAVTNHPFVMIIEQKKKLNAGSLAAGIGRGETGGRAYGESLLR